jgi:hypothetical protein
MLHCADGQVHTEVSEKSSTSTFRFNEVREQGRYLVLSKSRKPLVYSPGGSGGSFITVINLDRQLTDKVTLRPVTVIIVNI